MSENLELPEWCRYMTDPPDVTRYAGAENEAVMWHGEMSRLRYQIAVRDQGNVILLNVAQALAVAEMIAKDASESRPWLDDRTQHADTPYGQAVRAGRGWQDLPRT